jgi:hypothetical protein
MYYRFRLCPEISNRRLPDVGHSNTGRFPEGDASYQDVPVWGIPESFRKYEANEEANGYILPLSLAFPLNHE